MEVKKELLQLLKKQIEVEKTNVEQVSNTEEKIDNAAAKLFLHIIGVDSQKHAYVLKGIIEILSKVPPSKDLWEHKLESYVDPIAVKRELESHMKREAEMIAHVEKEIKQAKDEGLKQLLQLIFEEEKKHHKMLKTVIQNLYKITP